ncbi:MAG: phosphotransferase, partial [Anaerolineales bacterium]|nr:phosphotransferase [Anaerolineales bacterium]
RFSLPRLVMNARRFSLPRLVMNARRFSLLFLELALLMLLASCAPAASPAPEKITQPGTVAEPVKTVAVEAEAPKPTPTTSQELPLSPSPLATGLPTPVSPPTATSLPTLQPSSSPTQTPIVDERLVEIEWPPRMRLGESDVLRLALIPNEAGYILTTEYPEHQAITQTLMVPRPSGYYLLAVARLDGVGFDISPQGEQVQSLPPDEALVWRWSLTPRDPGRQRLSLSLKLRWQPLGDNHSPVQEYVAYSTGLDVHVFSFFGLTQAQALFSGLIGLVVGSGMSLFALFKRPRARPAAAALQEQIPNPDLAIELPPGLGLSPQERPLLQALFRRYARLVVEQEFLSGYSGARTFLALPIRPDGRSDACTIAKLGEANAIRREFENYENYVKDTLPPITARIQRPPVIAPQAAARSANLAALQYTFIAEPGSTPISLRQALLAEPEPALLHKLLDTFGPNWWLQRKPYTFRLAYEYDRVLPTHVVVEPAQATGNKPLDGRTAPAEMRLSQGDLVTLRNLAVEELRADGRSLSLKGQPPPGQPPLRVRWLSLERPEGASGRLVATRQALLRQYTAGCDLLGLPDPIERLPALLSETVTGSQSTIHGDLNLENVLVGPGGLVWLIDFAQTRDGHTLYDFAHLEAEIIAHVLAPQIASPQDYLGMLDAPLKSPYARLYALRLALSDIARRCLLDSSQPREYLLASTLACLGALKFTNLDRHAKHILYLSAAHTAQQLCPI